MPVQIIKKGLSNKTKTTPKNPDAGHSEATGHVPFIDKLSIVITPATEEDAYDIHSNIGLQFDDNADFKPAPRPPYPTKGFRLARAIVLSNTTKWPIIEYRHTEKKAERLRLEFNPRKIGTQGMAELDAALTSLLPNGWEYVVQNGRISRIDIAVDIPNVRPDEFLFLPKQATTSTQFAPNGQLQGMIHGHGQGNQTSIYNVKKKRLAKKQPREGKSAVRVERRLRNPKTQKLTELKHLENPFASMVLTPNMPPPPPWEKDWQWSMFEDSVKVRGLTAALALVPGDRAKKYRDHLKAHAQPWWSPEAIWSHWPKALSILKS